MGTLSQLTSASEYDKHLFALRERALRVFCQEQKYGLSVAMLVDLLSASGSRIQACLDLSGSDVDSSGGVLIRQGKGSAPLYASPTWFRSEFVRWAGVPRRVFAEINYRQVQRMFTAEGIDFHRVGYSQGCGTKIFRLCKAREMAVIGDSVQVAKVALGHRSAVSTSYYLNNERDRYVIKRGVLSRPSGEIDGIRISKNGIIRISR